MHLSDTVLYINNCLLFCVFVELMWICLGTQGSVQQQTDGDPSQSFCLTGRSAPTVSSFFTQIHKDLKFCTQPHLFYIYFIGFIFWCWMHTKWNITTNFTAKLNIGQNKQTMSQWSVAWVVLDYIFFLSFIFESIQERWTPLLLIKKKHYRERKLLIVNEWLK